MFKQKLFIAAALTCLASSNAFADASVVGLWKTIDDGTGAEKALIRITEKMVSTKEKSKNCFLHLANQQIGYVINVKVRSKIGRSLA